MLTYTAGRITAYPTAPPARGWVFGRRGHLLLAVEVNDGGVFHKAVPPCESGIPRKILLSMGLGYAVGSGRYAVGAKNYKFPKLFSPNPLHFLGKWYIIYSVYL
jgi:hypothetical protein